LHGFFSIKSARIFFLRIVAFLQQQARCHDTEFDGKPNPDGYRLNLTQLFAVTAPSPIRRPVIAPMVVHGFVMRGESLTMSPRLCAAIARLSGLAIAYGIR
jgi:hypothetical protein